MSRPRKQSWDGDRKFRSRIENRSRITLETSLHLAAQSKVIRATFGNLQGQNQTQKSFSSSAPHERRAGILLWNCLWWAQTFQRCLHSECVRNLLHQKGERKILLLVWRVNNDWPFFPIGAPFMSTCIVRGDAGVFVQDCLSACNFKRPKGKWNKSQNELKNRKETDHICRNWYVYYFTGIPYFSPLSHGEIYC